MAVVVDEEALGIVVLAAAAWVMELPIERNENLPGLVRQVEDLAIAVGINLAPNWSEPVDHPGSRDASGGST